MESKSDFSVADDDDESSSNSAKVFEPSAPVGEELFSQRWLREHGGDVEAFCKRFRVRSRRHRHLPLVLFKYSQLAAPFHLAVTRECRGLVLEEHTWKVVCYPYEKFFNLDEPLGKRADPLDVGSMRVYEKLDGSLATLYHYQNQWHVASSGTPDGDGDLTQTQTFAELFWDIWKKEGYHLPKDTSCNYIFEMIAKDNTIVVVPKEDELILHGVRQLPSCQELWPEPVAKANGWKCVKSFSLRSFREIEVACKQLNPHEHEGYVVVDDAFRRRKIKSPAYVGLSLLSARAGSNNELNMLRIIRQNEEDEFISYYPQWAVLARYTRARYLVCMKALEKIYSSGGSTKQERRLFSEQLRESGIDAALPLDVQIREWFARLTIKQAVEVLDTYAPEDMRQRADMLQKQKILFDKMGLDTTKKGKKKKKKKNGGDEQQEAREPQASAKKGLPSIPEHWEVVNRSKKRSNRKKNQPSDAEFDRMLSEIKRQDEAKLNRRKNKK